MYTHMDIQPLLPPLLSFLRFSSFVGLSLRLFRLLLRLVSLPQSRAKYSPFLHLPFFLALLALLFLSFFSFVSKLAVVASGLRGPFGIGTLHVSHSCHCHSLLHANLMIAGNNRLRRKGTFRIGAKLRSQVQ